MLMKSLTAVTIIAILFYGFTHIQKPAKHGIIDEAARKRALEKKQLSIIGCSPDLNYFNPE